MNRLGIALTLIGAAIWTGNATADLLTIVNPSFEDNILPDGGFISSANGWLTPGDSGTFNPTSAIYPGGIPEGENVAYSSIGGPFISQVLTDTLEANMNYELTMWVGNRVGTAFPGYTVQLLAGGILLAEDNNSLSPIDGEFLQSSVTYFADDSDPLLGQALEIRMRSFGVQANFDDVKLDATQIPEPGCISALFAISCLVYSRRR